MHRIIIADTSVLIALSNIQELDILHLLYERITITPEVSIEFGSPVPEWINVEQVKNTNLQKTLTLNLDLGESSAIALALEIEDSLLIIDERKGRQVAKSMGLKITGILGVILKAKSLNIIPSVKTIIEKLEKADFRISNKLKQTALEQAGEM